MLTLLKSQTGGHLSFFLAVPISLLPEKQVSSNSNRWKEMEV